MTPGRTRSRPAASRPPSRRRRAAAARSAAASGSGPTSTAPSAAWPGAGQRFALFGEVLLTGVLVAVLSLPVITAPLALALGQRHLHRYLRAEASPVPRIAGELRQGLPGALVLGAAVAALVLVLALDVRLAAGGGLPGGPAVAAVGGALLAATAVLLVRVTGAWSPGSGWRAAVRAGTGQARSDVPGSLLIAVALLLTAVATWMLPPLVVPALGCLAFAGTVVRGRLDARTRPDGGAPA